MFGFSSYPCEEPRKRKAIIKKSRRKVSNKPANPQVLLNGSTKQTSIEVGYGFSIDSVLLNGSTELTSIAADVKLGNLGSTENDWEGTDNVVENGYLDSARGENGDGHLDSTREENESHQPVVDDPKLTDEKMSSLDLILLSIENYDKPDPELIPFVISSSDNDSLLSEVMVEDGLIEDVCVKKNAAGDDEKRFVTNVDEVEGSRKTIEELIEQVCVKNAAGENGKKSETNVDHVECSRKAIEDLVEEVCVKKNAGGENVKKLETNVDHEECSRETIAEQLRMAEERVVHLRQVLANLDSI